MDTDASGIKTRVYMRKSASVTMKKAILKNVKSPGYGSWNDQCMTPATPRGTLTFAAAMKESLKIGKLAKVFSKTLDLFFDKKINDNLMHARSMEEHDLTSNEKKSDGIIVSGLKSDAPPEDTCLRGQWF